MKVLESLPIVNSFFGIDLKIGSIIIAVLGLVHPLAYCCTCFMSMSFLLLTIWVLLSLYFATSVVLLVGILKEDVLFYSIWLWYSLIFVVAMLIMMILLAVLFTMWNRINLVFLVIVGMLWYIFTIYFVLVVNSQRKQVANSKKP